MSDKEDAAIPQPPAAAPKLPAVRRFAGLEMLRFLAAVCILFWHYRHFFYNPPPGDHTPFTLVREPLYWLFFPFYERGLFAVQVFWSISGFIFFYKYGTAIHEKRVSLWEYAVFRFSRLYPLHFVTLLIVAGLQIVFAMGHGKHFVFPEFDLYHFALNVLMIPHWGYQVGYSFNAPVWSVSVEEFCYLSFFFLASGLAFNRRSFVGLVVASWIILTAKVFTPDFSECIALFLIGGVVGGIHGWLVKQPALLRGAVGVTTALIVGFLGHQYFAGPPETGAPSMLTITAIHHVFVPSLLLTSLLLWPSDTSRAGRAAFECGKLTYSVYMVHFPVQLAFVLGADGLGLGRGMFYSPSAFLVFAATTIGLGVLTYHRFEVPMQRRLRARLLRPRMAPRVGPARVG